jgi:hypothetical protein
MTKHIEIRKRVPNQVSKLAVLSLKEPFGILSEYISEAVSPAGEGLGECQASPCRDGIHEGLTELILGQSICDHDAAATNAILYYDSHSG